MIDPGPRHRKSTRTRVALAAMLLSMRSATADAGRVSDAAQGFEHGARPWRGVIEFRFSLLAVSCGQAASISVVAPGVARPISICRLSASAMARPSSGGTALPICRESRVHGTGESKAVREGLQARRFSNGNRAALKAVVMNVRVGVLADVSGQCPGGLKRVQFPPFVREFAGIIGRYDGITERVPVIRIPVIRVKAARTRGLGEHAFGQLPGLGIVGALGEALEYREVAWRNSHKMAVGCRVGLEAGPISHGTRISGEIPYGPAVGDHLVDLPTAH